MAYIKFNGDTTTLLGKRDTKRLLDACSEVKRNWLYPYEGCYTANRPTMTEAREFLVIPEGSCFGTEYKALLREWYNDNPAEAAKEKASRKEWEAQRDKQFRIIYGIAKRNGLYLLWLGNSNTACCGDQWEVYKDHESIARIYC